MNASKHLIKILLDFNINGSLSSANLSSKSITVKSFHDLGIDRREDDDVIAKIASAEGIFLLMTQDSFFANKTKQQWKKIQGFCLVVPSTAIVECFRSEKPNKTILKQVIEQLKIIDECRDDHNIFHLGINARHPNRVELTY